MTKLAAAALAITASLTVAVSATATTTTIRWSAKTMNRTLVRDNIPKLRPHSRITWARCKGIGETSPDGYHGFQCTVHWRVGKAKPHAAKVWAQPQTETAACVGFTVGVGCPAQGTPLPANAKLGDPRLCVLDDADSCAQAAAVAATKDALERRQQTEAGSIDCTVSSKRPATIGYRCLYGASSASDPEARHATVRFRLAHGTWRTAVTLAPKTA